MIQASPVATVGIHYKWIPEWLQSLLRRLLRDTENFGSVTNVFVHSTENENGQIAADMTTVEKAEIMLERHMSNEIKILQEIERLGCPQFKEP